MLYWDSKRDVRIWWRPVYPNILVYLCNPVIRGRERGEGRRGCGKYRGLFPFNLPSPSAHTWNPAGCIVQYTYTYPDVNPPKTMLHLSRKTLLLPFRKPCYTSQDKPCYFPQENLATSLEENLATSLKKTLLHLSRKTLLHPSRKPCYISRGNLTTYLEETLIHLPRKPYYTSRGNLATSTEETLLYM